MKIKAFGHTYLNRKSLTRKPYRNKTWSSLKEARKNVKNNSRKTHKNIKLVKLTLETLE